MSDKTSLHPPSYLPLNRQLSSFITLSLRRLSSFPFPLLFLPHPLLAFSPNPTRGSEGNLSNSNLPWNNEALFSRALTLFRRSPRSSSMSGRYQLNFDRVEWAPETHGFDVEWPRVRLTCRAVDGHAQIAAVQRRRPTVKGARPATCAAWVVWNTCRRSAAIQCTWRRSSVVRTSVSGRRTFADLRSIYGWQVTTLWVYCPLWVSQLGKLSLPSLWGRKMSCTPYIYMEYDGGYA